ncbi:hypothetical protein Z945_1634 [Sulfitobacter noctilucae]|nr:hypothetical protein Z945_1634 [Sulfitobacter noctilucae]
MFQVHRSQRFLAGFILCSTLNAPELSLDQPMRIARGSL